MEFLMCVHIERINGKVICGQIEGFKDLLQCEVFAITMNDDLLEPRHNQNLSRVECWW